MDGKRFDDLARMVSSGTSRRSILKGLLGLGAAAVTGTIVSDTADARGGSVTRFQPPPPPPTTTPPPCPPGQIECSTDNCCAPDQCLSNGTCCTDSEDRCYNQTLCCPAGTCSRIGNTDYCCPENNFPCGLDCCASELQCCDNECCPDTHTCLTRVFSPSAIVKEETCCPTDQTCDNQCCDGTCYQPFGQTFIPLSYDRSCCPTDPAFTFCPGTGSFADEGLCCSGDTPDCCNREDGSPACIAPDQCCDDSECTGLTDPATCTAGVCNLATFQCEPDSVCPDATTCCEDGTNTCCPEIGQICCGPTCCDVDFDCCIRELTNGPTQSICYDPSLENACCDDAECASLDNPATCTVGFCNILTSTCDTRSTCGPGETCCQGDAENPGVCLNANQCCFDSDCSACQGCVANECQPDCTAGQLCCSAPDVCNPANGLCGPCADNQVRCGNACCFICSDDDDCAAQGLSTQCVDCINGFCTTADDLGDDCNTGNIDIPGYCVEPGICLPCLDTGQSCSADVQCCGERFCDESGTCQTCVGTQGPCTADTQCCGGGYCDDAGTCQNCLFDFSGQCETDNQCCGDSFCDPSTSQCTSCVFDFAECSSDGQCCFSLICVGDVCIECFEIGEECEADAQCCGVRICNEDICELCRFAGDSCTSDTQCCGDVACLGNVCGGSATTLEPLVTTSTAAPVSTTTSEPTTTTTPSVTTTPPGCSQDSECNAPLEFCHDGQCIPDRCLGQACASPCAACNRVTGGCDPIPFDCPNPCHVCGDVDGVATCVQNPADPCCGVVCAPCVSCNPASGLCEFAIDNCE